MLFLAYNLVYTVILKKIPFVYPIAGGMTHAMRYRMGCCLFTTPTSFHAQIAILVFATSLWYLRRLTEFEEQEETRHVTRFYTRTNLLIVIGVIGGVFPLLAVYAPDSHQFRVVIGCSLGYLLLFCGYLRSLTFRRFMKNVIFQ